MARRQRIGLLARHVRPVGHARVLADRLDREAEVAGVADEAETIDVRLRVETLVALRAVGPRREADPPVGADGLDLAAGRPRRVADGEGSHGGFPLNLPSLWQLHLRRLNEARAVWMAGGRA